MKTVHLLNPIVPSDGKEIFDSVPGAKRALIEYLQTRGVPLDSPSVADALIALERWPIDVGGRIRFIVTIQE